MKEALECGTASGNRDLVFDGFEVIEEAGRGGSAIVYRAREIALNREVALKVLVVGNRISTEARSRFLLEAQAVAQLEHPNIVPLYSAGESDGRPYIVMKWIEGGTLAQNPRDSARRPIAADIARRMAKVARAVQHAHDRGILHRDLKPSNVLIDGAGEPFVADFGLARCQTVDAKLTATGVVIGTPTYLSPEQTAESSDVTTATDVWGLGVLLYELLAGHPPFEQRNIVSLLRAIQQDEPKPPLDATLRGGENTRNKGRLERDLELICLTCLRKQPRARYPSAGAVAEDLERCLDGRPILARPAGAWERVGSWYRRHRARVIAGSSLVLALLLLAVGGPLAAIRIAHSRDVARAERERALRTVDRLETASLLARLEVQDGASALALLARRLRAHPENSADADRVLWILRQRSFAVPVESNVFRPKGGDYLVCPDGRHLVAYHRESGVIEGWDVQDRAKIWEATNRAVVIGISGNNHAGCWAVVKADGGLDLRDFANGTLRARLEVGVADGAVSRFSHDGKWLAVGGYTNVASLWEVRSGRQHSVLPHGPRSLARMEPETRIKALDFDPGSKRLATGGTDGVIRIWSVPEGRLLAHLEHGAPVGMIRIHPSRPLLASIGPGRGRIWDMDRATMLQDINLGEARGNEIGFGSDNASACLTAEDGLFAYWNLASPLLPRNRIRFHRAVGFLDILSETTKAAVGTEPGGAWWLSIGHLPTVVGELPSPYFGTRRDSLIWFRPDGRQVLVKSGFGWVGRWRLPERPQTAWHLRHDGEIGDATFDLSGQRLAAVAWNGDVTLWNLGGTGVDRGPRVRHGERAWQARFSPDGSLLATSGWDPKVRLWDSRTGLSVGSLDRSTGGVWWIEFVARGKALVTAGSFEPLLDSDSASVEGWSLEGTPKRLFGSGSRAFTWTPALSPDATHWVVPDRTPRTQGLPAVPRVLDVIDTSTGAAAMPSLCMPVRGTETEQINSTAYSADGKYIAGGGVDHAVVWDARTGEVRRDWSHPDRIRSVCFHPDGRRFLTAGEDGTARLWDLKTGGPWDGAAIMRHAPGTSTPIFDGIGIKCACFSPDGRWIATAAADRTVRLWDASNGLPIAEPLLHEGPVLHVGFSPDGQWLVSGSTDGSARLWRLAKASLPTPKWLPDFLEAVARHRLTEHDETVPVPDDAFFDVRRQALSDPPIGVWAEVLGPYFEAELPSEP